MVGVLDGIRVLDFGRFIAGPYCASLLGDMGAEVIRIEKIGGGEDRFVTPVAPSGEGGTFIQLNRNKKGLAVNIASDDGRKIIRKLVETSDVVVANLPQNSLEALGLDYEALIRIKPDIILASVSAFGTEGPYKDRVGFDGVGQMMSGAAYMAGAPDKPASWSVPYVDFSTALASAFGVMCALYHRQETGQGQIVRGSLLRSALTLANSMLIEQAIASPNRIPLGNRAYQIGPGDIFQTKNGDWLLVQVLGSVLFKRWARLMGEENQWVNDPRFTDDQSRGKNGAALSERMQTWCDSRTLDEAIELLNEARIPCAPVYKPQQTLEDPNIHAAGTFSPMEFPGLPTAAPVVSPITELSKTPASYRSPAPMLGADTESVLEELGYTKTQIEDFESKGVIEKP